MAKTTNTNDEVNVMVLLYTNTLTYQWVSEAAQVGNARRESGGAQVSGERGRRASGGGCAAGWARPGRGGPSWRPAGNGTFLHFLMVIAAGSITGGDAEPHHWRPFSDDFKTGCDVDIEPAVIRVSVVVIISWQQVKGKKCKWYSVNHVAIN
jgi:hypothetical protein